MLRKGLCLARRDAPLIRSVKVGGRGEEGEDDERGRGEERRGEGRRGEERRGEERKTNVKGTIKTKLSLYRLIIGYRRISRVCWLVFTRVT